MQVPSSLEVGVRDFPLAGSKVHQVFRLHSLFNAEPYTVRPPVFPGS